MAVLETRYCSKCNKQYTTTKQAGGSLCGTCYKQTADEKEAKHFAKLDKLPLEDRIRKIEKWIYNYKSSRNLSDMRF